MIVEQDKEKIENFKKVFLEYGDKLVIINPGMGAADVNTRWLFSHLYGGTPERVFNMRMEKDTDKVFFTDFSEKYSPLKLKTKGLTKNFSLIDTCYKLGVVAYPTPKMGLFLGTNGMLIIETYGKKICDSQITAITGVCAMAKTEKDAFDLTETFMENVVEIETEAPGKTKYLWVRTNFSGLDTEELEFDKIDIDLKKNYNDDIPYNDIVEILNSKSNELILFNGKPGTGKTSLIKHLMSVSENKFLYIDSNLLLDMDSSKFIAFLLNYRNSVVVLEDCEKILSRREQGNPFMGTLLNLTDGILGETIKCKFICSFNCSESKIDEALLREGRLSLKYCFDELSLEKTKVLVPNATAPMTLASIYKKDKTVVVGGKKASKIGF